jgi:hypothetical protein
VAGRWPAALFWARRKRPHCFIEEALSNDNSTAPTTHGAMFGSWKRTSGSAYAVNMVFMRFNADNTLAGTQKVQRAMVMAADGNHIAGTVAVQTIDTAGVVAAQGCASETGVRVF